MSQMVTKLYSIIVRQNNVPFTKKTIKKRKKNIEQNIIVFYEFCYSDYVDFTFDFNYHWT